MLQQPLPPKLPPPKPPLPLPPKPPPLPLLNKLLDAQLPPIKASLLCNPLDREPVEQWLSRHCGVPWTLRVESTLAAQSLVLETEDGGFHINWTDTLDNLVTPSPKANIK